MKKLALLLALLMIIPAASLAAEPADGVLTQQVRGLLTEVYGYTQEEAETFGVYMAQEDDDNWYVYSYSYPNWVYSATIRKTDQHFADYYSPFTSLYASNASENSVRTVLRAIGDNGWFDDWNADSKAAFAGIIDRCGDIRMNASMRNGLHADDYTPAQALDDLFLSCYGDTSLWSEKLLDWRDVAFFSFGLTGGEEIFAMPRGVEYREEDKAAICEFTGEIPDALSQVFSVSQLEGWECLAGAYRISDRFTMEGEIAGSGLAAFAHGEERLLVLLLLDAKTQVWQVIPVGKSALLPGRALYITYASNNNRFNIIYPISDTEQESFQCRTLSLGTAPTVNSLLCELMEYRYVNLRDHRSVVIAYYFNNPFSSFYMVTTTQSGNRTQTRYPALASNLLDYIDVTAFPRTEEDCKAASEESPGIPEGYGIASTVHLRAEPSSHAKDLGMYRAGTLVEVLDILPGSEFPWLRVRIGQAEGYMSGNYVAYQNNEDPNQRIMTLGMAKTKGGTALRENTNLFAKTLADLPAGAVVRVLAETGNWLHVSVPENADDWLMRPDERSGYVKANAVVQAATTLQLMWLMPEE